ncbi:unnamed protein product [Durusdinium trenchii]|uniref:Uncharacterized protein n=2 Tax=Durusdinium trenchii TaxID=1381693 RepID=A0ABP0QJK8_9DINO
MQVSMTIKAYGEETTISLISEDLLQHPGLLRDLQAVLKKYVPQQSPDDSQLPSTSSSEDLLENCDVLKIMAQKAEDLSPASRYRGQLKPQAPHGRKMKARPPLRRTKRLTAKSFEEAIGDTCKYKMPVKRTSRINSLEEDFDFSDLKNCISSEQCSGPDAFKEGSENEIVRQQLPVIMRPSN